MGYGFVVHRGKMFTVLQDCKIVDWDCEDCGKSVSVHSYIRVAKHGYCMISDPLSLLPVQVIFNTSFQDSLLYFAS